MKIHGKRRATNIPKKGDDNKKNIWIVSEQSLGPFTSPATDEDDHATVFLVQTYHLSSSKKGDCHRVLRFLGGGSQSAASANNMCSGSAAWFWWFALGCLLRMFVLTMFWSRISRLFERGSGLCVWSGKIHDTKQLNFKTAFGGENVKRSLNVTTFWRWYESDEPIYFVSSRGFY